MIRKKDLPASYVPSALATLVPLLGDITLINLKGPQAKFDIDDYLHLWACAALFCRDEKKRDPAQIRLMAVAPRVTEQCKAQIEKRGRHLSAHETPGISLVTGSDHQLWLVETDVVADPLLRFFSRRARPKPGVELLLLTAAEQAILRELISDVQYFKVNPRYRMRYPDLEQVTMTMEEFAESVQEFLPMEKRLKGVPSEERLRGLPSEERLKGMPAEERVRGMPAEERLRGLPVEERLKGVPSEERLKGVPVEERLKGLTAEERAHAFLASGVLEDMTPELQRQVSDHLKPRR